MSPISGRFHVIAATLAQPNFGLYVAGNAVSLIGTWMQRIGIGWLAWDLSGSAAVLGLVAFADLFPAVLIGPFGGAIADRMDRRRVIVIAQVLNMAQAATLFLLAATGVITVPLLIALTLFTGVVIGFNQPARLAFIPSLVPREHLGTAVAINAVVFNGARFIGPAIAGVIIVTLDVALVFALNALSFLAFLAAVRRLDVPPFAPGPEAAGSVLGRIGDGVRYVAGHPAIGPVLVLHLALALGARPVIELFPGFADRVFEQGAAGLAMLSSSVGMGAVAGGIWLAGRSGSLPAIVLGAALVVTLSIFAFALAPIFALAVACTTIAGFALIVTGAGAQTLVQSAVDEGMRGRVMSLYGLILRGGPALGALLMGAAADLLGFRLPLIVGTLAVLIAWTLIWRRRRRLGADLGHGIRT